MKTHFSFLFIFFLSLLLCGSGFTQISNNNKIVNDSSSWATLCQGVCPGCPVWTQYVYFDGDSIFNARTYKKVLSCDDSLHENIKYKGLIRQLNQKTYFIPANSQTESLLYDFSMEEGVTFEYQLGMIDPEPILLEVKTSDTVEVNGVLKKRLQIGVASLWRSDFVLDTWIEDIGSLSGIFYPRYWFLDGVYYTLLCYHQNNELIYKNPDYLECYYDTRSITSVQTITINDCSIFPNPVDNILNISCLNNAIDRIDIFDISGRKVYSQTSKDAINVSSFSKGFYTLKVYDAKKQVAVFKIVKK